LSARATILADVADRQAKTAVAAGDRFLRGVALAVIERVSDGRVTWTDPTANVTTDEPLVEFLGRALERLEAPAVNVGQDAILQAVMDVARDRALSPQERAAIIDRAFPGLEHQLDAAKLATVQAASFALRNGKEPE